VKISEMEIPICPKCNVPLSQKFIVKKRLWKCNKCRGIMINSAVLKHFLGQKAVNEFYRSANTHNALTNKKCPSCRQSLNEFKIYRNDEDIYLDLCKHCQLIWFDEGEIKNFSIEKTKNPNSETEKVIALASVESNINSKKPLILKEKIKDGILRVLFELLKR
jgi:Zn-finger nucleic acid-binding protein